MSTDPRTARSREAILNAARGLLIEHGPGAVTHQRVAQQAGVGRATVYRHWPQPEQLMLDVMAGADLPYFRDPRAPVREWLRGELRRLADELALPPVAALSLTLMQGAIWDPAIAERRDQSMGAIHERLGAALTLAVAEGELGAWPGAHDATSLLLGPLVYRASMQAMAISDDLIDQVIRSVGPWRG